MHNAYFERSINRFILIRPRTPAILLGNLALNAEERLRFNQQQPYASMFSTFNDSFIKGGTS